MSASDGAGRRIAQARRRAALTQTELGERIGLSLWDVERLEDGAADPSRHLGPIARVTGVQEAWLAAADAAAPEAAASPQPRASDAAPVSQSASWVTPRLRRNLVLGSLTLIVVVRFFTEVAPVLPRAGNFVDIPLLVMLVAVAAIVRPERATGGLGDRPHFAPAIGFLAVSILSTVLNLHRIEPAPVLVFLYGFLAPLGFYYAAWKLWPAGEAGALSRLLVALGVVQLAVVLLVDVPLFASSGNPDDISGTFGENAYQLVYFLVFFCALLAGIQTFEAKRRAARLALPLIGAAFVVIFLAQYRALLVTTALSVVLAAALLSRVRGRGLLVAVVSAILLVVGLSFVARLFPTLYFGPTVAAIREDPGQFVSGKIQAFSGVAQLYGDDPAVAFSGTGPGTYSSRAWRTFSQADSKSQSNVAGAYATRFTGGRIYETDVSRRYVTPQYRSGETVLGSKAVSQPFSSYVALLAEVGVFGFVLMVAVYVTATVWAARQTVAVMRAAEPGDPLPALLLACTIAFATLLQMALLENWLEVTRVTTLAWITLAVVTKELQVRATQERAWRHA